MPADLLLFGPYQLDTTSRRLSRDAAPVALPPRQFELLLLLVTHAGQVLTKDALIDAAWQGVAVTDNSLEQAISGLRRLLGQPDGAAYIETLARRGYRFTAEVRRVERREPLEPLEALEALLAPHRAWIEGRAALETLERSQIVRGVIRLARGDEPGALADFERELAGERGGQLYARECCANAWYAVGAVRLRRGDRDGALLAAPAAARLAVPELALARAIVAALAGRPDDAARVVDEALASAGDGSAFWLLPVEPLLRVDGSPRWAAALGRLSMRAA